MLNNNIVEKDERTMYIENSSYKYGYLFTAFALLINIAYRSFNFNEAPWDLFGIIIISGFVMSIYQYKHNILEKTWIKMFILTLIIAFVASIIMVIIRTQL